MPELNFRAAREADRDFCERLYLDALSPLVGELLTDWGDLQLRKSFTETFTPDQAKIIMQKDRRVGWFQVQLDDTTMTIGQIFIAPRDRNKGLGTAALRYLIDDAARAGRTCLLSVMLNNPAQRLYTRLGFRETTRSATKIYMEYGLAPPRAA